MIGESWELADLADDKSLVSDGPLAGMTIRALLDEHGPALGFTTAQCVRPFGLLIKFLDANDVLSVQVHPDENVCRLFPDAQLKTECWYVLDAESGSVIYRGLIPGVNREKLLEALKEQCVEDFMAVYPARNGDFHYLPAGTIHALGAGVVVAEIQTPSNTTYRLYDWNRRDSQGHGRPLHIEQALASVHYTDKPESTELNPPTGPGVIGPNQPQVSGLQSLAEQFGTAKHLLDCPHFSVVHVMYSPGDREIQLDRPIVMICLEGTGTLVNQNLPEHPCTYQKGDTILWPALSAGIIKSPQSGTYLLTCLGPEKA